MKNQYPVFNFKQITLRLGEETCCFRRINPKGQILLVKSPCAWQIFRQFDGTKTLDGVAAALAPVFEITPEVLLNDIKEMIFPLLENNILTLSDTPKVQNSPALKIIAPRLRKSLHIDLTEICNEKCIHCLADKDSQALPLSVVLSALESGSKAGLHELSLSGGEALLHPDFWQILEYARALGYNVTLFSNGLKIDEKTAAKLADLNMDNIRLSVYSTDENIHDKITQVQGSLKRTLKAAQLLKQYGNKVFINCPVMKVNFSTAEQVRDYCLQNNFEFNLDANIQPTRDGRCDNNSLKLSHEEKKHITELMFPQGPLGYNVEKDKLICAAGSGQNYYIDSKGDVSICPTMPQFIGNIKQKDFFDIIQADTLTPQCAAITIDTLQKCKKCELRLACQRCHARALRESGSLQGCAKTDLAFALVYRQIMQERNVWKENKHKEKQDEIY